MEEKTNKKDDSWLIISIFVIFAGYVSMAMYFIIR